MMETIMEFLDNMQGSIRDHVNEVSEFLQSEELSYNDRVLISNRIKSVVQDEATKAWRNNHRWGAILLATGVGKTKIAIDYIMSGFAINPEISILIVVPTQKLRDKGWKEEFSKWGGRLAYAKIKVKRVCYVSINKIAGEHFDLVVLDEGHNITVENSKFFYQNRIDRVMLLTATKPTDEVKIKLLTELRIMPVYQLNLDQAVKLGLVAPYEIIVVKMKLDNVDNYLEYGAKGRRKMGTEYAKYQYLSRIVFAAKGKFATINRMQFIYNLRSKTTAATRILDLIPKDNRGIIFCGSIEQAKALSPYTFHSESDDHDLNLFLQSSINTLACVRSLNEGENLGTDLDYGLVAQINSKALHLVQRIGRLIRYRPNHIGQIIVLAVEGTVDLTWVFKATKDLDQSNIRYITLEDLLSGKETISFNTKTLPNAITSGEE